MHPTISQIARRARVSQPVVSKVLNGGRSTVRVSEKLRVRIETIARELGYRPNAAAQATARGRFNSIALMQSTVEYQSLAHPQMLEGVYDALSRLGLHLMMVRLPQERLETPDAVPAVLRQYMCDGLLMNVNAEISPLLEQQVGRSGMPVVWVNSRHEHNCVYPDDFAAGHLAARAALLRGHRRIAFVNLAGPGHFSATDRRAGYAAALREAGLQPVELLGKTSDQAQRVSALTQLLRSPDRPTALVDYDGDCVATAVRATQLAGLQFTTDLYMAAIHAQAAHVADLFVDTVWLPERAMGDAAAQMLAGVIDDPGEPAAAQALPPTFCGAAELAAAMAQSRWPRACDVATGAPLPEGATP